MKIHSLDHIAITVKDVEASVRWYEEVLGLKQPEAPNAWGPIPILVLTEAGNGIALFPSESELKQGNTLMHIAFLVDYKDLETAKARLDTKGIASEFQDHVSTYSLYFFDPDGYEIELTAPNPDYRT